MIRSVTDERVFGRSPSAPNTPSLGFPGTAKSSDEVKARAIGRKRGADGLDSGDVVLQRGQTVAQTVRENIAQAFGEAGYDVRTGADAGPGATFVDVHIKRFWTWFDPGYRTVTMHADIGAELDLSSGNSPISVDVRTAASALAATDRAWLHVANQGLADFRAQAAKLMAARGRPVRGRGCIVEDPTPQPLPSS